MMSTPTSRYVGTITGRWTPGFAYERWELLSRLKTKPSCRNTRSSVRQSTGAMRSPLTVGHKGNWNGQLPAVDVVVFIVFIAVNAGKPDIA